MAPASIKVDHKSLVLTKGVDHPRFRLAGQLRVVKQRGREPRQGGQVIKPLTGGDPAATEVLGVPALVAGLVRESSG